MNKYKDVLFIMPFGKKEDIDFDEIYKEFSTKIKNIFANKIKIYRVDYINNADIDEKMYKSILAADIVIADITNFNPNVMYELGIRHSFMDKTTKLIINEKHIRKDWIPFDINHLVVNKYSKDNISKKFIKNLLQVNEKDSIVRKNIVDLPSIDNNKYKVTFNKWSREYLTFKEKIEEFEKKENYVEGLEYINKKQEFFSDSFEPYISKKILFTYKISKEKENLLESRKMIDKIPISNNTSSELLGLKSSIYNRLFLKSLVNYAAFDQVTSFFYVSKKTIYSYGTYLMSRVLLVLKKKLTFFELKKISERMHQSFEHALLEDERDKKYHADTEKLIKAITNENINIEDFEYETSKENMKIIIKVKKENWND